MCTLYSLRIKYLTRLRILNLIMVNSADFLLLLAGSHAIITPGSANLKFEEKNKTTQKNDKSRKRPHCYSQYTARSNEHTRKF